MTEIRQATEACIMGSATEQPCTYPATEPMQRSGDDAPKLCAIHASTEALYIESDALALALELLGGWETQAREHDNGPTLELLARGASEFSARKEHVDKVLDDLEAAEVKLMRS